MSANTPDSLFKYLDANGALNTLQSRSLRWSSPACFVDPFEISVVPSLPFEINSLLDSTIKLASSMIFAPEQPKGDSPLVNAIKRWREESRFGSQEEAIPVLRELLGKMVEHRSTQLEGALNQWQEHIRNLRLCCFSSKSDIPQAWEKFADCHRGVVLRFASSDSPFDLASPIVYQSDRAHLTTIREQLGSILHNRKDAMVERFKDLHLVKSSHLKVESEWRCCTTATQKISVDQVDVQQWHDLRRFNPDALTGIYFGIGCADEFKQEISSLAKSQFPSAKLFQANLSKVTFTIEFEKVSS